MATENFTTKPSALIRCPEGSKSNFSTSMPCSVPCLYHNLVSLFSYDPYVGDVVFFIFVHLRIRLNHV
ncbi:hypothetical protein CCHR01_11729 [Colletotrichum chrysophilum]|uniref:Uncharacterized protein n=1 Tax=Colletotrichum chrysophilum TaxID=1836956 RepID=A0AAD9ADA7_9PEZI|nr:hypothetical protein CCHR01_11729 [Colletotrichum chrysophilum]